METFSKSELQELFKSKIDFKQLSKDKQWLYSLDKSDHSLGILHFIDFIQDWINDEVGLGQETVFPHMTK